MHLNTTITVLLTMKTQPTKSPQLPERISPIMTPTISLMTIKAMTATAKEQTTSLHPTPPPTTTQISMPTIATPNTTISPQPVTIQTTISTTSTLTTPTSVM